MQLVNPLEQQNAVKTLYSEFVSPVCAKYGLTRIELDILLFLANNTRYDTATDIVEVRFLAKSQVSAAIKNLEARGCLRREYQLENRAADDSGRAQRTGTVWRGAVGWIYPRRAGAYAAQHGAHPQKRGKVSGG